jgi:hypothetical protein
MSWNVSRFRAGDLVEVRSREEILATLDLEGCVDGMPFMPEMLQFCGRTIRVSAVAHKTCDVAMKTRKARRLDTMVHLENTACDGSAHGGCQADCNLFWKDVWLKPSTPDGTTARSAAAPIPLTRAPRITEQDLARLTVKEAGGEKEPVYSCQATRLFDATEPLAWWNPRQYLLDVATGNHSVAHVLRVLVIAWLRVLTVRAPRGYRLFSAIHAMAHRILVGRELPFFDGKIPAGQRTPAEALGLQPGELVRIKSKSEIEATLDTKGLNRGLFADIELAPFCGTVATVKKAATRFIDDSTGLMQFPKQPCIVLDRVACLGEYSDCRLLCPRAIPSYWREIWLERVETGTLPVGEASRTPAASVSFKA